MTTPRKDSRAQLSIRLPRALHRRLVKVARERDVSVNRVVERAVEGYVARLEGVDSLEVTS